MDSPTQGTDAAAPQIPNNGNDNSGASALPGVQKRIDELTAQLRATQEENARQLEMTTRLMMERAAATAPAPVQPAEPPPPEGVDPGTWSALRQLMREQAKAQAEETQKQIAAQFSPVLQRLQFAQGQSEFERAAQGHDAETIKAAQAMYGDWQRRNLPGTAEDAFVFAVGRAALAKRGRDALGRFNSEGHSALGGAAPGAAAPKLSLPEVPAWADQTSPEYDYRKAPSFWRERQAKIEEIQRQGG